VEFQTGHALWALHDADVPAIIRKWPRRSGICSGDSSVRGWMDPLQSNFEIFRTPFRETQMAVLALARTFPGPGRRKVWTRPPEKLSSDPAALLDELDNCG